MRQTAERFHWWLVKALPATVALVIRTLFITTMRYNDQISGDKRSVCHCNSVRCNNNSNTFAIRTKNLGTKSVVIKRVYCTHTTRCWNWLHQVCLSKSCDLLWVQRSSFWSPKGSKQVLYRYKVCILHDMRQHHVTMPKLLDIHVGVLVCVSTIS